MKRCVIHIFFIGLLLLFLGGCSHRSSAPSIRANSSTAPAAVDIDRPQHKQFQWWFDDRWPPIVQTARDVERLPASAPSVRARGLSDGDIPSLARLRQLSWLDFYGGWAVEKAKITDDGLARLSRLDLPQLDNLALGYCSNITDAGLASVGKMHTITQLILIGNPQLTDAGLSKLLTMKKLTYLDLRGCSGITDRGLFLLAAKTDLTDLDLSGCPKITSEGIARFRAALPNVKVRNVPVGSPNYPEPPP